MVDEGEGMLGYSRQLFARMNTIDELRNVAEFEGKEVDR
jgi:hypothetical protein